MARPYDGAVSPGAAAVMATHDPHDPTAEKPAMRRDARARRDAIPAEVRSAAAHAAALRADEHVLATLPAGATIGLYASMRTELSTAPLAAVAAARGLVIAYPRTTTERALVFHRVELEDTAALAAGRFGIPEPSPDAPTVEIDELAAIVVPALLFDRAGYRLGWGGGWYDTTLPRTRALRVGFALEAQIVDAVPRAPHDEPVHVVVTDAAVYRGVTPWTR
jgi:5-formyltetrahydrofolate cyclo-ligase